MAVKKLTKEVKEQYKKEHGSNLRLLLLPLDDYAENELEVLAIVPSRKITAQVKKHVSTDPGKAEEILVKNCLLTSKEEVLKDDGMFSAAVNLISDLIPVRQGKFGKL